MTLEIFCREVHELQSLIKTTLSGQIQSDGKGRLGVFPLHFQSFKLYIVL